MKHLFAILFIFAHILPSKIWGQVSSFLSVSPESENVKPLSCYTYHTNDEAINSIFTQFGVTTYAQSYPGFKTPGLQEYYHIYATGNIDSLKILLDASNKFSSINFIEYVYLNCQNPVPPVNDHEIVNNIMDNWALDMVEARCAWSITKGDSNIFVAVVDGGFDTSHVDINGKVIVMPDNQNQSPPQGCINHGTRVAGMVAARTNNNIGIASLGYQLKVAGYLGKGLGGNCYGNPGPSILEAYRDGRRIINVSWSGTTLDPMAVSEMTDSGVILVTAAGNDSAAIDHGSIAHIPGVVNVSGVDINNNAGGVNTAKSGFVDICAPATATPCTEPGNQYIYCSASSSAAPLVSATAGLILSLNPCLTPAEVEEIIKASADPVSDAASFPGLVGAGRLNAYEAVLLAQTYKHDITSNATWTGTKRYGADVVVHSGVTLTISDTLLMGCRNKIIVKPGGHLIIDGGYISVLPYNTEGFWQGIFTETNPAQSQTTTNQGKITIKNGSILEHALSAVNNTESTTSQGGGGIIHATNSTFLNNRHAASFLPYNGGGIYNDLSFFKDCRFTINDNYSGNLTNTPFKSHVTLWDVHGVDFNGCVFVNNHTGSEKRKGDGIYSYNADFKARPYLFLQGGGSTPGNRFDSMKHGIVVDGDMYGVPTSIIVDRNSFSANSVGIKVFNVPNVSMIRNTFTVGNGTGIPEGMEESCEDNIGIYTKNTSQFRIEENVFNGVIGGNKIAEHSVGTLVDNSGENDKELYKNSYTNFDFGVYAKGKNRFHKWANYLIGNTGLRVVCNTFTTNVRDITVAGDPSKNEGIAQWQGYHSSGNILDAGNQFITSTATHIHNSASTIQYYYNPSNALTLPTVIAVPNSVFVFGASNANGCASRLSPRLGSDHPDQPLELTASMKENLMNLFWENKSERDSKMSTLTGLMNGGFTTDSALLDDVANLTAIDAMNYLLNYSPYLSAGVIEGLAPLALMDNSMLMEVYTANPDVLRQSGMIQALSNQASLDESDVELLVEASANETSRTIQEAEISFHQSNMSHAINMFITDIKCKEEITEEDSLVVWLDRSSEVWAEYQKTYHLFHEGAYVDAGDIFENQIPTDYILDAEGTAENSNLWSIFSYLQNLKDAVQTIFDLQSHQIQALDSIAQLDLPISSTVAKSILTHIGYSTRPCANIPSYPSSKMAIKNGTARKKLTNALNIYPNPANDYVVFEYKLQDDNDPIFITISNTMGQQVGSFELKAKATGKYHWDTRHLPTGNYFYKANSVKKDYGSGKIVVVR